MIWFDKMQNKICHFILWKHTPGRKIIVWTREEKRDILIAVWRYVEFYRQADCGWPSFLLLLGYFSPLRKVIISPTALLFPRLLMPLSEVADGTDRSSAWMLLSPKWSASWTSSFCKHPQMTQALPSLLPTSRAMWLHSCIWNLNAFVLRPQAPRWATLLVSIPFTILKTNEHLSH